MDYDVFIHVLNYHCLFTLLLVPCIDRRSINNHHYTLIVYTNRLTHTAEWNPILSNYTLSYTTPLFKIQAPTCFGSSLPLSESFLDPPQLLEMLIK
jgi:hypothetical protein